MAFQLRYRTWISIIVFFTLVSIFTSCHNSTFNVANLYGMNHKNELFKLLLIFILLLSFHYHEPNWRR